MSKATSPTVTMRVTGLSRLMPLMGPAMTIQGPQGRGDNRPRAKECDCPINEQRRIVESAGASRRKALSQDLSHQGAQRNGGRDEGGLRRHRQLSPSESHDLASGDSIRDVHDNKPTAAQGCGAI